MQPPGAIGLKPPTVPLYGLVVQPVVGVTVHVVATCCLFRSRPSVMVVVSVVDVVVDEYVAVSVVMSAGLAELAEPGANTRTKTVFVPAIARGTVVDVEMTTSV